MNLFHRIAGVSVAGALLAATLTGCISGKSEAERIQVTKEFLDIAPTPERSASIEGQRTAVCVDAVRDLWESVGIDLDSVALEVLDPYLVATFTLDSISGVDRKHKRVYYPSILQSKDGASFELLVENPVTKQSATLIAILGGDNTWYLHGFTSDSAKDRRIAGELAVPSGRTVVVSYPLEELPEKPWRWKVHMISGANKHEWCPGAAKEAGWLVMP